MFPILVSLYMGLAGAPLSGHGARDLSAAFERLVSAKDWREEAAAAKELASLGDQAFPKIEHGALHHTDVKVRRACFQLLIKNFMQDKRAAVTIASDGLRDADNEISYCCAFCLGEQKVYAAHRLLRAVLDDQSVNERTHLAAAKSLAELGEADVIRELYYAVGKDDYMSRHLGNIGIKALTGKNLNDFESYEYGEGAFVSGGKEATFAIDAVRDSSNKAERFASLASFSRWVKEQRPDLYKHLSAGW